MRRAPPARAFLFTFAALLIGCADDRSAGGTTETDNMLAARTFDVDSLLGEGNASGKATTIAMLRLNTSNALFDSTSPKGADLAVETIDRVPIPFRVVYWDKQASIGRIEVRIAPALQGSKHRIRLRWDLKDSVRSDSTAVWRGISSSQRLALTSVLVSDFEQNSLQTLLPVPGPWTTNFGGDSASISDPEVVLADAGRDGRAIHVSYTAPIKVSYARLGVPLGNRPYILRSLDSIEFWARGAKTIVTVAFECNTVSNKKAWTPRYPDSTWKRFTVRPSELDSPSVNGGNVGWLGVRDSVTHLGFFVAQGNQAWFDSIRLHGIAREDLE